MCVCIQHIHIYHKEAALCAECGYYAWTRCGMRLRALMYAALLGHAGHFLTPGRGGVRLAFIYNGTSRLFTYTTNKQSNLARSIKSTRRDCRQSHDTCNRYVYIYIYIYTHNPASLLDWIYIYYIVYTVQPVYNIYNILHIHTL